MTAPSPEPRLLHAGAFAGLFCVGLWATSFGPALPFLAERGGVSLDAAGLLLTVLFVGSISASGAMAVSLHRIEARKLAAAGLVLAACGAGGLGGFDSWGAGLAAVALLGVGDGFLVAAAHAAVAKTAVDPAKAINRLNLWFAAGATVGPVWAGAVLSGWDSLAALYGGIAAVALASAVLLLRAQPAPQPSHRERASSGINVRAVASMGAVLFLYVGAEIGLGSWVSSYSSEAFGAGVMTAALVTSGYWAALALGRVVSGWLFGRGVAPGRVLLGSIAGAMVASAALALADGSLAVGAAAALGTGLCFGPIWPAAITIASQGSAAGAPATMVTIGNAGGIVFPWLQGRVLVAGGPSRGIAMTAAICVAMLLVAASFDRGPRRRAANTRSSAP